MVSSRAATVDEYLDELPADRRAVVSTVRDVVNRNLPTGYRESMGWGMIVWGIPLEHYPKTYNQEPLGYVALAAQKNYFSLYLFSVYQEGPEDHRLRDEFSRAGKKLDMGKSCVRFRTLDDLPLDVIGRVVAATPPDALIARYETNRPQR